MFYIKGQESLWRQKTGPREKLNDQVKRRILNAASNSTAGVRKIQREVAPEVSHTTVHKIVKSSTHIVRQRMMKCPPLTNAHKLARVEFAERHVSDPTHWLQAKKNPLGKVVYFGYRLSFRTRKSSISMGRMVWHTIGVICIKISAFLAQGKWVVEAVWFGGVFLVWNFRDRLHRWPDEQHSLSDDA